MAFSTVTGSNGVTSLVGTTGIDITTIVSLTDDVFIGANTGDDSIAIDLPLGQISGYDVRMGGGDDIFNSPDTILDSFISMDGETLANDGNDDFDAGLVFNSEIVGRGGDDDITVTSLFSSTVNGNTGADLILLGSSSDSFVYGGQGIDEIATAGAQRGMLINGNKGADLIVLGADTFVAGSVYGGQGIDVIDAGAVDIADAETAGVFLSGDLGDDFITATEGVDTINGGDGDDDLDADAGADTIDGGAGDDVIDGGTEGDVITTGSGNDTVVLDAGDSVLTAGENTGFDTITDFSANTADVAGGADANGDIIDTAGIFTTYAGSVVETSGGVSLAADLESAGAGLVAGEVAGVTIRQADWAGNYLIFSAGAGFAAATDDVIKVNTSVVALTDAAFA